MLSHFKSPIAKYPRKMMTFSSNGLISINSKEEILQRCRKADYKECLINGYPEILENNGILIQSPNLILINLDLSLCTTCAYPIRKLDYLLKKIKTNKGRYGWSTYRIVDWQGLSYLFTGTCPDSG